MEVKYVAKCFETSGKFIGYLSYFDPLGRQDFSLDEKQAIIFDSERDCVVSHKQTWELGRDGGTGYYELERVFVPVKNVFVDDKVFDLINRYNKLTYEEKQMFKKKII